MTAQLREALAALRFNSAETPDDVWQTSPSHVDGLHPRAEHRIRAGIADAKASDGPSPIGLALQGRKGIGKTHLLGSVRRMVQREGGYFFLIELTSGQMFWDDVADAMRSELLRTNDDGDFQLTVLLKQLCERANASEEVTRAVLGEAPLIPDDLRVLLNGLRQVEGRIAVECGDTVKALVLYASEHADVGRAYLEGLEESQDERRHWGLPVKPKRPQTLVRDISRILALTGPCVVAVDQLDTLVNKSQEAFDEETTNSELAQEIALISDGLMQLRETTRRTLTVVACLPNTWVRLGSIASDTVGDRFTTTPILVAITDAELARVLVEKWLGAIYQRKGITPPHPTWPVAPEAFGSWQPMTPRELLKRIHAHAESCFHGDIRELRSFDEQPAQEQPPQKAVQKSARKTAQQPVAQAPGTPSQQEPDDLAELDAEFERLRALPSMAAADVKPHNEDEVIAGAAAGRSEVVGHRDRQRRPHLASRTPG